MLQLLLRAALWIVAFLAALYLIGLLAPIIIPALIALVIAAWKRPQVVTRVMGHRLCTRVPRVIRSTPMRFALAAAILVIPLSAAVGQSLYLDDDDPAPARSAVRPTSQAAQATPPTAGRDIQPTETAEPRTGSGTTGAAALVAIQPTDTPAPPTPTPEPPPAPTETPIPPTPTPVPLGDSGQVTRVIDGDTLDVAVGGETLRVRIIGVDTPETKDPNSPVMCYGAEATAKTQELVDRAGGNVILEKDVSETDRYGRYLRYVWLLHPDGQRMLNYELVAGGYAQVSTYPPDVKYVDLFLEAQRQARDEGRGLWGACGGFGVPLAPPTPTPEPAPVPLVPQQPSGDCDPSYPDVCIPSPPPDLDCADIPYRRFRVLPPDPHRFDGSDDDGWGCESG